MATNEIIDLRADNKRLQKALPTCENHKPDAERYRWLRDHARRIDFAGLSITSMAQLGARIDAAREGK